MHDDPVILDSSGQPTEPSFSSKVASSARQVRPWGQGFFTPTNFLSLLTLIVLALQFFLTWQQSEIINVQQKLATRPSIEFVGERKIQEGQIILRKLTNTGPYALGTISVRWFHFKKFQAAGWQTSYSSAGVQADRLSPKASVEFPIWNGPLSHLDVTGDSPVPGADFFITEIQIRREIDDKLYLYLQPIMIANTETDLPFLWIVDPPRTATSAPMARLCSPEALAFELMFEFYRRNPLPNPVEMYNYHYVLGNDPGTNCLEASQTMKP
jgi:hypothetical protein